MGKDQEEKPDDFIVSCGGLVLNAINQHTNPEDRTGYSDKEKHDHHRQKNDRQ